MKIVYSSKFLKSFEKLPNDIQIDFRLGTHKLKGRDEWSFLITYKIRTIFVFRKDIYILVNIGDHSIYRK